MKIAGRIELLTQIGMISGYLLGGYIAKIKYEYVFIKTHKEYSVLYKAEMNLQFWYTYVITLELIYILKVKK
jgi:hypothetical protein